MNPTGSIPNSDSIHCAHPFTRILIPTDNGPGSKAVLDAAFDIVTTYGATVHALYVIDTRSELGHWDYVIDQREREGEQAVETIATRGAEFDVGVVTHIRYGTPHDTICAYADDHDIDLIVMGTHGRTGIQRFLHAGSVAERVLRGTTIPVLVVRLGDERINA